MTYDAVVIDDERLAIDGMKRFPWEVHGFQLVATFQNPTNALEWLKANSAHLVVADIRMPQMSGLELAKVVHDLFPEASVILFSGHSEFSYAQKAIRYGVVRYVLKPVDDDELAAALADVSKLLNEREREKHWTRRMVRDRWLRAQISGSAPPADERSVTSALPQLSELSSYRVALLPNAPTLDASELEESGGVLHTLELSDGHVACIIDGARLSDAEQTLCSAGAGVGLSAEHHALEEIPAALNEARQARAALFARPRELSVYFEDADTPSRTVRQELYAAAATLSERVAHYEFQDGVAEIQGFLEGVRESAAPEDVAKQLAFTVALGVQRLASRWIGNDTEERLESIPDPFEAVERSRDISELEKNIVSAVSVILERIEAARARREQDSRLDRVLGYIDAHYHELISLDDVAEFAHLHPSRFSVWFRDCMGETYIEYLTRLRVSTAKQLLLRSGETYIRDVAVQVGYPDARYFSQVFKRVVGTTPRAYQRAQLSMQDAN